MRYVLAAILVCAVGMPAASALPKGGSSSLSVSKGSPIVEAAKRARSASSRRSRGGRAGNGIHPLAGSAGY
jgi:hypothetical protein